MARVRNGGLGDVGLDAIYAQFGGDRCWTPDLVSQARCTEERIEHDMLVARPDVVALMRHAHEADKRVILVSDSYFGRDFFARVLATLGIAAYIDELYISCERRARKDNGALWDRVISAEGVAPGQIVHFGDNLHSDIGMATTRGIRAAWLPPTRTIFEMQGDCLPPETDWYDHLLLGPVVARLGATPWVAERAQTGIRLDDPEALGYTVFGPALFGFIGWLVTNPALKRISKLYFFAREGHFLSKLYSHVREAAGLRALPEAVYLQVSRRLALTIAQAVEFDPLQVIGKGGFRGTIAEFLEVRLGMEFERSTLDCELAAALPREIELPADTEALAAVLTRLEPAIRAQAQGEFDAFRAYARQAGFGEDGATTFVDIGYSGTIQHALQRVLNRPLIGLYMVTAPNVSQVREAGGLAFGCFQDALYQDMRPERFMHYTVLFEALLSAPHGQVMRFRFDEAGEAVPEFAPDGIAQQHFEKLERIYAGAQSYVDDLLRQGGATMLGVAAECHTPLMTFVQKAFDGGVVIAEELLAGLSMEDRYSGNGEVALVDRLHVT
ncbi:MAG TPA: HAD family hydrolase [Paraburkholderia sp.]|uniref:HAD family hydrolase n=1 Tax=Paraburkholderia sp. TaxID=1926495 RepID=UPI002B4AA858|nr:HAD family hydrolase [Paraburkholderia sp.]HKR40701.1 HAD family hydrolase [Paraburkholderia sp.]